MKKHFVEFLSPGTFVSESTTSEINSWDVEVACTMAADIKERHAAVPYGFRFITRERGEDDLDSKVTERSGIYYLGGEVRTLEQVVSDNRDDERILRSNMVANGYTRIIVNTNSWKFTAGLEFGDVVLDWPRKEKSS